MGYPCDACAELISRFSAQLPKVLRRSDPPEGLIFGPPNSRASIEIPYLRQDAFPDLPSLHSSADNGCPLCALFYAAFRTNFLQVYNLQDTIKGYLENRRPVTCQFGLVIFQWSRDSMALSYLGNNQFWDLATMELQFRLINENNDPVGSRMVLPFDIRADEGNFKWSVTPKRCLY